MVRFLLDRYFKFQPLLGNGLLVVWPRGRKALELSRLKKFLMQSFTSMTDTAELNEATLRRLDAFCVGSYIGEGRMLCRPVSSRAEWGGGGNPPRSTIALSLRAAHATSPEVSYLRMSSPRELAPGA